MLDARPVRPAPAGPAPTAAPVQPTESSEPSPEPVGEPAADLPDGRYFVSPVDVTDGAPRELVFDLAYLLEGDEARQAAIDHGAAIPVPNDYFIVNDNAQLRQAPVSPTVVVRYLPVSAGTSQLQSGLFDPWAAAVNDELQTDYAGGDAWWWITLRLGQIERIEQQFLP